MLEKISKLIDVKSFVTLGLIGTLIVLMFVPTRADDGLKNLFIAITSSVVTYYFTKTKDTPKNDSSDIDDDGVG